jgi:phosphotriesterase-related protein
VGIAGTGIKAGILKAASDAEGIKPFEENVLRGVARAHKKTGIPIMLHSYSPGEVGRQQVAVLKEEGVDLNRVKMDHSNDTTDVAYLTWLLGQGCYLGMDRYPGRSVTSAERTNTMKALIDAGYIDRLLPSHDHLLASTMSGATPRPPEGQPPRTGLLHIKDVVIPQLREMGVPEEMLSRLCVLGPRNFFEGVTQS